MIHGPIDGKRVFVIAEACDNHLGDTDVAKEMALQSKLAGADAVKFQHHLPDEEMLPEVPMSENFEKPLYDFLKENALKLDQHAEIKEYCDRIGIQYLCTPFSLKAACEINDLGVDMFKIGSGEMTDLPTLVRIAEFGKPMIVSTGMADFEEIDRTYDALVEKETPLVLMNCISEYPPDYGDMNLGVITTMRERYCQAVIGHSDHTPDLYTTFAAIALGAKVIEKHVILDKRQPGPDQSVSIDMRDLAQMVDGVRKIEAALGNEKKIHTKENQIRKWAFRSLITTCEVKAGQVFTRNMIWSKRPGTGIPSHRMEEIVGRRSARDISANVLISWKDVAGAKA